MPADDRMYPTTVRDSAGVKLYVTRPGHAEIQVEGISSLSPPPNQTDSREKTTFDSGNQKEFSPGLVDGGEVSFSAMWNPSHPGYLSIRQAHTGRETMTWRMVVPEDERLTETTVAKDAAAIAATGIVTFSGTAGDAPDWGNLGVGTGAALIIGATHYLIQAIDENGIPTVTTIAGARPAVNAAAAYKIVLPQITGRWNGFVTGSPPSIETDANVTVDFTVKVTGEPTITIG